MFSTSPCLPRFVKSTLPLLSTVFLFFMGVTTFLFFMGVTTAFAGELDGVITTLAGTGTGGVGGDGGAATSAQVNFPQGTAVDSDGNVYIADTNNHRIRKVTVGTGIISTFAGTGTAGFLGDGGAATAARLSSPTGVAVDAAGNLYIADQNNHRIRQVASGSGVITTVAGSATSGFGGDGGPATAAQLQYPSGVTVDSAGNIYIADTNNHRVRKVTQGSGTITTVAGNGTAGYNGDGPATGARLNFPAGVAVDGLGNLFIADQNNNRIRMVTPATGIISTVAGTGVGGFLGEGGPATTARLNRPIGVAVDGAGNIYITDYYNHRIRKLTVATGIISTVAGSGTGDFQGDAGLATAASLQYPAGVAVDSAGAMYIADYYNHRVRKVAAPTVRPLLMTTLAGTGTAGYNGDGAATSATLSFPSGVAVDYAGNVYIADLNNNRVRKINTATNLISTVAGTGVGGYLGEGGPATAARLNDPTGVAVDGVGNVYIADQNNHRVRKVTVSTGVITTVAGNGTGAFLGDGVAATTAALHYPTGIAVDADGNLYIADQYNHRVRKVTAATGLITTIAGNGTTGVAGDGAAATAAQLNYPHGVAVDGAGNVYIADRNNHRIRKVTAATGVITTYAGTGTAGYTGEAGAATAARLYYPSGVAVDAGGNVYVADRFNMRIRKIAAATGVISTIAGSENLGFGGDGGVASAAQLNYPFGVAVDVVGSVYIADTNNHRVRKAAIQVAAPTGLTVVRSGSTARLTWNYAAGATSYNVYRGTTPGGGALIASGLVTETYLDAGVTTGTTYYYTVAAISFGTPSGFSNEVSFRLSSATRSTDFDGDGKADVAIYRPSAGAWYVLRSSSNSTTSANYAWGVSTDVPVAGDYDGDGNADIAVYRPSAGLWYVLFSSTNFSTSTSYQWGDSTDTPVPGDYDGDGKTDLAVYRSSTGVWYILLSSTNFSTFTSYQWGVNTDVPVPGDYDGDGKTDVAIYRPATGVWYTLLSSTNFSTFTSRLWGTSTDTPVPGDYDGDAKTDVAIYRSETGTWYVLLSTTNFSTHVTYQWGLTTDIPVPTDYDGDAKTDIAIYRPETGTWYILLSTTNSTTYVSYQWGVGTDIPVPKKP